MSFLDSFRVEAQTLLASTCRASAIDAVKHDRFDATIFAELVEEVPALAEIIEDLNEKYPHTYDMTRDALMEFYKSLPQLRSSREMDPGRALNLVVAKDLDGLPGLSETRSFTQHDKYGSAMATVAVAEHIKKFLDDLPGVEDLEDKLGAQKQAADTLAGTIEGEDTEQIEAAMQALSAAAAETDIAQDVLDEAMDSMAARMRGVLSTAVSEVGDGLAQETAMFASWGVERGELLTMDFAERARKAAVIRSGRMAKALPLVGRYRMMASAQQTKRVNYVRDELFDTELGDNLLDAVDSEYSALLNRHLHLDFLRKLGNGELLVKKFRGAERLGDGALVFCVDNSASMLTQHEGVTREQFAKAFTLASLDQAHDRKRDFAAINFSERGRLSTWDFPASHAVNFDSVVGMTNEFFNGGTCYETALDKAVSIIEDGFARVGTTRGGDIVFLTDGECKVSAEWMRGFQKRRDVLGFRVFGVFIGSDGRDLSTLEAICDGKVRNVTEFANPEQLADLSQML